MNISFKGIIADPTFNLVSENNQKRIYNTVAPFGKKYPNKEIILAGTPVGEFKIGVMDSIPIKKLYDYGFININNPKDCELFLLGTYLNCLNQFIYDKKPYFDQTENIDDMDNEEIKEFSKDVIDTYMDASYNPYNFS